jgi:hypothetical protein
VLQSIKEVWRTLPRLHDRNMVSELEVEQVARVHVLRLPVDARMRVRLDCNHTAKQVWVGRKCADVHVEWTWTVLPAAE